jgi:hypothetical protein
LLDVGKLNGEESRTDGLPHERHHTPGLIDGSLVQSMALLSIQSSISPWLACGHVRGVAPTVHRGFRPRRFRTQPSSWPA